MFITLFEYLPIGCEKEWSTHVLGLSWRQKQALWSHIKKKAWALKLQCSNPNMSDKFKKYELVETQKKTKPVWVDTQQH